MPEHLALEVRPLHPPSCSVLQHGCAYRHGQKLLRCCLACEMGPSVEETIFHGAPVAPTTKLSFSSAGPDGPDGACATAKMHSSAAAKFLMVYLSQLPRVVHNWVWSAVYKPGSVTIDMPPRMRISLWPPLLFRFSRQHSRRERASSFFSQRRRDRG